MFTKVTNQKDFDSLEPTVPLGIALLILFGVAVGTIVLLLVLQTSLPAIYQSIFGPQREAFWDLARTSGLVAYLLMWLSVAFGLIITDRMAHVWPGGPQAFDLHQFASLLGLAFAVFHALILLGVQYIHTRRCKFLFRLPRLINHSGSGWGNSPFMCRIRLRSPSIINGKSAPGSGAIHFASFIAFAMITVHGLLSGSDTTNWAVLGMYALTGLSVMFLTVYRIITMADTAA